MQPVTLSGPVTVIGIDPGSQRTGWGVVNEVSGVLRLVDCGVVRTAAAGSEFCDRLAKIYRDLDGILAVCALRRPPLSRFLRPKTRPAP